MIPHYYRPEQIGQFYSPDVAAVVEAGRVAALGPSSADKRRTLLILVDEQVDFIHADGALSVPGALDDTRRIIEWLYRHAASVTTIAASLDSHVPLQIFFPTWWADEKGRHPAPYTTIRSRDVGGGRWRPLYEPEWSHAYVRQLEQGAKKTLMIWPYHVLIGTSGHSLSPALYEALAFHTAARQSQPIFLSKGSIPKTEHYSMLEPEVKVPEEPLGSLNVGFLNLIAAYDRVYIAGEAKSHCVLETVSSMMRYFESSPEMIRKLYVLTDCMSSIPHAEIDFETITDQVFASYALQGLNLVRSTDDLI